MADQTAKRPGLLRRIAMGAGHLPGYGNHPGTSTCVFLTFLTGVGGIHGGWLGFIVGCSIGAVVYLPMWICGCIGRANAFLARTYTRQARP